MLDTATYTGHRLDQFVEDFAGCFRRRDQARWLRHYLQGLLCRGGRKNVEGLIRDSALGPEPGAADPVQALQNFVNQSPWDERRLWQRLRARIAPRLVQADAALVVSEFGFVKQGQQSVGVQRQFWGRLGRKVNCQLAVAVTLVSSAGACPLALRLYLPRNWSGDEQRLLLTGVPEEHRPPRNRSTIALELLDELHREGLTQRPIVIAPAYGAAPEFRQALQARRWSYLAGVPTDFPIQAPVVRARSWQRVRTASAWTAAGPAEDVVGLFADRLENPPVLAVGNLPEAWSPDEVADVWAHVRTADDLQEHLGEELGLTHFEGRSWRGFHHHACLVALAHAYQLLERQDRSAG